jgi:hypothetical protein
MTRGGEDGVAAAGRAVPNSGPRALGIAMTRPRSMANGIRSRLFSTSVSAAQANRSSSQLGSSMFSGTLHSTTSARTARPDCRDARLTQPTGAFGWRGEAGAVMGAGDMAGVAAVHIETAPSRQRCCGSSDSVANADAHAATTI